MKSHLIVALFLCPIVATIVYADTCIGMGNFKQPSSVNAFASEVLGTANTLVGPAIQHLSKTRGSITPEEFLLLMATSLKELKEEGEVSQEDMRQVVNITAEQIDTVIRGASNKKEKILSEHGVFKNTLGTYYGLSKFDTRSLSVWSLAAAASSYASSNPKLVEQIRSGFGDFIKNLVQRVQGYSKLKMPFLAMQISQSRAYAIESQLNTKTF